MKYVISGGRDFGNPRYHPGEVVDVHLQILDRALTSILLLDTNFRQLEIVYHGAAEGADTHADVWCRDHGILVKPLPAQWDVYGKAAGPIRNAEMAKRAGSGSGLISFWNGRSKGTRGMMKEAHSNGFSEFHLYKY